MNENQPIKVSSARDLIAFVPYHLGYTPTESLTLVSLRGAERRVGLMARVDLTDATEAAVALVAHALADGAHAVALVAHSHDPHSADHALDAVADAAAGRDLPVVGAWIVSGDTYAPHGHPHQAQRLDAGSTITAAAAVLAGSAPAPTRADLDITPAPPADRARAALAFDAVAEAGIDRALGLVIWRAMRSGGQVTARAAGTLSAYLADVMIRDAILCDIIEADPEPADRLAAGDPGGADAVGVVFAPGGSGPGVRLVQDVATLRAICALYESPATRSLLAMCAWWAGDGTTANIHTAAALDLEPGYRLADLIAQTLGAGLAPGWARTTQA